MKKIAIVILGVLTSFGLTILAARILFRFASTDSDLRFAIRYISSPLIAVVVGYLVGLVSRDGAKFVAGLALVPWTLWFVLTTNWRAAAFSQIAITIASAVVYLALGVGAAAIAGKQMAASRARQVRV